MIGQTEDRLEKEARPAIRRMLDRRTDLGDDREDLEASAMSLVAEKLSRGESIESLPAYAAACAESVFRGWLRRRRPVRHRLLMQVRLILEEQAGLTRWSEKGVDWAGFENWRSRPTSRKIVPLFADAVTSLKEACQPHDPATLTSVQRVIRLLRWLDGPIEVGALVDGLFHGMGLAEPTQAETDEENQPSLSRNEADGLALRSCLIGVWQEAKSLPVFQRHCLLLGGGLAGFDCPLLLFRESGAPEAEILEAVKEAGLNPERWIDQCPISDSELADWLKVRENQVIGLRRAGRERLYRRMRRIPACHEVVEGARE